MITDNMTRCQGVIEAGEPYLTYHDNEWGKPEHDEQKLYETLLLEAGRCGQFLQMIHK